MTRSRKPHSAPEDPELFRAAVADVARMPHHGKAELKRARPRPIPSQRLRDDRQTMQESLSDQMAWDAGLETGEELLFARNGIGSQTVRKLRRGHWVLQDEIDLHGYTVDEARGRLAAFLAACVGRGLRCVRVVHGKGLRSKNREPILKRHVAGWLARREEVLAFCQARGADGGAGAVVVLLRGTAREA